MTSYKCFNCNKNVDESFLRKRIRCPYCGSKILFKERTTVTKVKAI
jgi:DNA-directed RNA polymerase subunit RPC12/RpoP